MPLWGTTHDSATNKPKFLPESEDSNYNRADCYATQKGWVMQAGHASSGNGNTSADPEVLVAIGGLAGATDTTGLRAPTVTKMRFVTASLVNGGSKTMTVEITWDEAVTVAGSPQIVVANGNQSSDGDGNATLTYTATGSTANRKRFTNASLTFSTNDVYTLGGSNISLNSGTISDTVRGGTAQAASLVLSGLTAVTKTVVAS
tara:strand:+ start:30 stop:638 length:609 start_codon:yes stop_codon:yes gene_type:complete